MRPGVQQLLDAMTNVPAIVQNGRLDIIASNRLGMALFSEMYVQPQRPANFGRFLFLDPRAQAFYLDWADAAQQTVALLRAEAGRAPYDRVPQRPRRRTLHPERRVPHPVGVARRARASHRHSSASTTRSSATSG